MHLRYCFLLALASFLPTMAHARTDEEVLAGAEERIEQIRKGDITLLLTGPNGKPLPEGTEVKIEQTKHKFLFSGNCRWLFSPHERKNKFETDPELAKKYSDQFTEIFNYVTVPIFWGVYEPQKGKPMYDLTQASIDWAKEHGMKVKAHPLVWNWVAEPAWLKGMTPEQAKEAQIQRVKDFMQRFKGQITVYDVVNEPAGWDRQTGWKNSPLLVKAANDMGIENWQRLMYQTAREADPTAMLTVNDFVNDGSYEKCGIDPLIDEDGTTLFDGIGYQSHMFGGTWPMEKVWNICEQFSKYKKPIHFTEVSIVSGDRLKPTTKSLARSTTATTKKADVDTTGERTEAQWKITPETEERQARDVVKFYTTLFSHPSVEAINWWYVTDNQSHPAGSPPGLLRKDMSPRPAYTALKELIKGKWWTRTEEKVNGEGQVLLRGFYGEYKLTLATPGGEQMTGTFAIVKDKHDPVHVTLAEQ